MIGLLPKHVHRYAEELSGHGAGTLVYDCIEPLPGGRSCLDYRDEVCPECAELQPGHVDGFAYLLRPCTVCGLWQDHYCAEHVAWDRQVICPDCCGWPCCAEPRS